jgi:hypothetical protein
MNKGLRILAWVALGLLAVLLFGLVTMSLWNWLVPVVFNGPVINFWQALGLFLLAKILFGGWGGKGHCHGHPDARSGAHWKARFYDKFSSMTPEERAAVKEKMKEKWCNWSETSPKKDSGVSND